MKRQPRKSIGRADDPAYWNHDLLTAEQERALAIRVKAGDRAARDELILKNQRLVVSLAKRLLRDRRLRLDDLVSAGNRGLMRAIAKYDPARGYRLTTYANYWIRQTIQREIEETGQSIRVPSHAVQVLKTYRHAGREIEHRTGHEPDFDAACEAMNANPYQRRLIRLALRAENAEFQRINPETVSRENDRDHEADEALRLRVDRLLNRLTPRQCQVVRWHYGIGEPDGVGRSLAQIARDDGRSYQACQQSQRQALRAMKKIAGDDLRRMA